jgi:hypothetical protein
MDLLKPIKSVTKKVKEYMDEAQKEQQNQAKLDKWKGTLTTALSNYETFRSNCSTWDTMYNGSKTVNSQAGYMSNKNDNTGTKDARQVINIVFQLIESQIDVTVPKPNVDAIEGDDDNDRKMMVEGMLSYMADSQKLERINSENERIVKKNSMCVYKVGYNPNAKSHKWIGKIETTNPHPGNIIPQPGVFRIKDMDYMFHIENRTIDQVCRTYGEEFRAELESSTAEYKYLDTFGTGQNNTSDNKGWISVIECWYKDKDGDVCLLTWADETILKDEPKFFYKRDESGKLIEYDEIEVEQYQVPAVDENEQPILDENGMQQIETKSTIQVPVHVPKQFPFVIQYNIPKEKSFTGKADPDIISDQQEGIKKVISMEEEKLMKGTTKILTKKGSGLKNQINNATMQVIETDNPQIDLRTIELNTPSGALKDYYGLMLQAAKDCLGVTDASQGTLSDSQGLSGRAIEQLSANSQGRLSSKLFEKNIAYTELYNLYYDFALAFYDEPRPFRTEGNDNKAVYGYFDKSKLIKQDDAGEWYYPEFDIYITADQGLPRDKRFIMDSASQALAKNAMDSIEYWTVMESIGYPNASAILKMEQSKQAAIQQQNPMLIQPVNIPA